MGRGALEQDGGGGAARARRVAAILAASAYLVPSVPHFFGPLRDPHHYPSHDGRAECMMLSFGLLVLAFVLALFGARGVDRRTYWPNVAAVGLFWFLAQASLPYGW